MFGSKIWFCQYYHFLFIVSMVNTAVLALSTTSPTASPTIIGCDFSWSGIQCHPTNPAMVYMDLSSNMHQARIVTDMYWGLSNNPVVNDTILSADQDFMFQHVYSKPGVYNLMYNITLYTFNEKSEEYDLCIDVYSPSPLLDNISEYDMNAPNWPLTVTIKEDRTCVMGATLTSSPTTTPTVSPTYYSPSNPSPTSDAKRINDPSSIIWSIPVANTTVDNIMKYPIVYSFVGCMSLLGLVLSVVMPVV
jgi:hypothetical protein